MRLLADEDVDGQIVDRLRGQGHDVLYMAEADPGTNDDEVLSQAFSAGAVLVTADKDFGELVFRMGQASNGVVLLRLAGLSPDAKADLVADVFARHGDEFHAAFSVITPGAVRIRPR